jgi:hypothetical protein
MHNTNLFVRLEHELRSVSELRKAVYCARQQLRQEASQLGYNILLVEG